LRGAGSISRDRVQHLPETAQRAAGAVRPGEAVGTPSGDAANLVRRRWEQLRDEGLLEAGAEPGSVRRTWHVATIAVLAVLVTACVVATVAPLG
ncbi:hypothetical protein GB864_06160, partial [Agromyces sp. MMS17-SY077]|nr:hypothetical protein [Agromyces seonyuensis]